MITADGPPRKVTTFVMRRMAAWGFYQPGIMPAWNEDTLEAETEKLAKWGEKQRDVLKDTE